MTQKGALSERHPTSPLGVVTARERTPKRAAGRARCLSCGYWHRPGGCITQVALACLEDERAEGTRIGREPLQKPGKSAQDYETPPELIAAVTERFGALDFDLATSGVRNAKAPRFFTEADNALLQDWTELRGNLWLNPPFARIGPWAAKCAFAASRRNGERRIFLLTPGSIGADWFRAHVHREALVLGLSPRLTFVGADDAYPKDCMLSVFGEEPGFDVWRWMP